MNQDEEVQNFLDRIDSWINDNKLNIKRINHDLCEEILNLSYDELKDLNAEELLAKSYILSGYSDYINETYNKEKSINEYANLSINYIIAPFIDNYGDNFVKYEKKYNLAIKENPLASKLFKLKNESAIRIQMLENKALNMKRMSDIILELSKRKQ